MRTDQILLLFFLIIPQTLLHAGDWSTFRGDSQRSGVADENIDASKLSLQWTWNSDAVPQTAWASPARWDAYKNIINLRAMRNYDAAFGVAVSGSSAYVASSSEDAVICLDLNTGGVRWKFWAGGPVRITPTIAEGRVYFGCDDGQAYCIDAKTGKLMWKFRPPMQEPLILHNGRMISRWPCRTGLLIKNGIAYCAFSMLPWDPSFLCAIDAKTGKTDTDGCFVRKIDGATIEGAMAASDKLLVAPQGRIAPMIFNLADGSPIKALSGDNGKGGGGSFVMISDEGTVCHGPGNLTGWITVSDLNTREALATHKGFNSNVLSSTLDFRLADNQVSAVDRKTQKLLWKSNIPHAHDLVLNRQTLFVGARNEVVALNAKNGEPVWRATINGNARLLILAGQSLLVSTDEGELLCFQSNHKTPHPTALPATKSPTLAIEKNAKTPSTKVPGLNGRWTFHSGMNERAKRRGLADAERRVLDAGGRLDGTILGEVNLRQTGGIEALVFDGNNSVMLTKNIAEAKLPTQQLSVEAWVRIDQPTQWGGIIGAFQDNGAYEKGWLLGYNDSKFSFALNAEGGKDALTYLKGKTDFKTETWYHVVGTYDGKTQRIYVNGELENSSDLQTGSISYPPQAFFEIGAYHDKDENNRMKGRLHEISLYSRALTKEQIAHHYQAKKSAFPKPITLPLGPYAHFIDRETVEVSWQTEEKSPSVLILQTADGSRKVTDPAPKTDHRLRIDGLKRQTLYSYQIVTGTSGISPTFELDTTFNFTQAKWPKRPNPYAHKPTAKTIAQTANQLLKKAKLKESKGICLVLGAGDGHLMYELARQSNLTIIGVETDASQVATARATLSQAGIYGRRTTVRHVESLDKLPYTGEFANLLLYSPILQDGKIRSDSTEVMRLLRPDGGLALIYRTPTTKISDAQLQTWLGKTPAKIYEPKTTLLASITRGPLKGAGEWSHLYGLADNSAYGGEDLGGARSARDLRVQWLGRPGPRAQPDRNGRKPSPLSAGGRLFVQGLHRIIAIDAYNGTVLWALDIPPMQRFNVPRDSSNWCADSDHVFVAIKDALWQIDARTGEIQSITKVHPGHHKDWQYDWSYIARHQDKIIGSAVKSGSAYVDFWGGSGAGWYDDRKGPVTFKVCSDNVFAHDKKTGRQLWTYSDGVILNSTITVADGRVYFVESRNKKVLASQSRRIGMPELWQDQYIVALDLETGSIVWEQPMEIQNGTVMVHMARGKGTLVVAASGETKYKLYALEESSGKKLWQRELDWIKDKGDHGMAMSRPGIAENKLYMRPHVLDLKTGKTVGAMPAGHCGTYALTSHTAIYRKGNVTLWDRDNDKLSSWKRLRPGCWLSTIPAAGMILSPEAGGGCSCGIWIETSLGFMPKNKP
ncbi:MAG: PQQ-binding-like beta-propeller repeat protein [Verrucomicrobiales bacterium]|nr:PQQ-binding-like beta-propeller repeat protein [Verrucomicrobiales bacterium]